jgi:hypothetical protein
MVEKQHPKNLNELKNAILKSWQELDMKFVRNCIRALPKNLEIAFDKSNSSLTEENIRKVINNEPF